MIDLLILDCDGVLVDSEPLITQMMSEDLSQRGLRIAPEECHALFVGGTMRSAGGEARRLGADIPDDWATEMDRKIAVRLAEGVALIDGIEALLDWADAQGIATAVASNGPQAKMRVSLGPSGLWDRFAGRIHSGHDDGKPKPDPHMLLKAARLAGVDPAKAAMIDDSPAGVNAALAAGVLPIGLATDGDTARLAQPGVHVIQHLGEVPDLLRSARL